MHSQFTCCPALISIVFLQHGKDEPLLEFADRLRVQNITLVHLQDECFELISHGIPLSFKKPWLAFIFLISVKAACGLHVLLFTMQQIESLIKATPQF